MKKETILLNIARNYTLHTRCKHRGMCAVYNDQGGRSPIGSLLTDEELKLVAKHESFRDKANFENLPERIQDLGFEFVKKIVDLHDYSEHWDENGLTRKGLHRVMHISRWYKLELKEEQIMEAAYKEPA